jgi:hypothetical protein
MTIQHKPIKKTLHGLPRFTTVKGRGLRLATLAAGTSLARQHLTGAQRREFGRWQQWITPDG